MSNSNIYLPSGPPAASAPKPQHGFAQPPDGFSFQIDPLVPDFQFIPAASLATGNVFLPNAAPELDGLTVTFGSTQAIAALTVAAPGANIANPPTTLKAGECVRFIYFGDVNIWIRR